MKTYSSPILHPAFFAFSLGCALAVLPLLSLRAQDANPPAPSTTQAVPPVPKTAGEVYPANTDNKQGETVKPKKGVQSTLTAKEKQFMHKAAGGNAAEVQTAELALKKSENPQIKEFAEMMIKDHTDANKELLQVAQDDGLSNFKVEVDSADKAMYSTLAALTGTAFDASYIKHAVADHTTDVKEYKEAQGMVKDAALKSYVEKTEPIIEGHLKSAKEMQASKGGTKS